MLSKNRKWWHDLKIVYGVNRLWNERGGRGFGHVATFTLLYTVWTVPQASLVRTFEPACMIYAWCDPIYLEFEETKTFNSFQAYCWTALFLIKINMYLAF